MTLTIGTMAYNAFPEMKEAMATVLETAGPYRLIFLDNGSDEPLDRFLFEELRPHWEGRCQGEPTYIRNEENAGVVFGWQQIIGCCQTDILALIHNDVQILDPGWDTGVLQLFASDPKLGLVSFFGCPGVMANGLRGGIHPGAVAGWSNMSDAEQHGMRIIEPRPIAVPDSFAMVLRRRMLDKGGGLDLRFAPDHGYDRALGLQSLALGFHNMVAPVACTHLSRRSRSVPQYGPWLSRNAGTDDDWQVLRDKDALLLKIWGPCLPLYVNEDFTFANTDRFSGEPTGRDVLGYDWRSP